MTYLRKLLCFFVVRGHYFCSILSPGFAFISRVSIIWCLCWGTQKNSNVHVIPASKFL